MSSTKPDFDALMVDWLYGELDDAEAERFEEYLATHPEAKAEAMAMKQTRAAFGELDEAEPTHSLSAILMREAALAVTPTESVWSRLAAFFQPIVMHPAASAAATVVLLCGVAGALYLRGGSPELAQPRGGSQASAPIEVATLEAARDPAPAPVTGEMDYGGALGEGAYAVDMASDEDEDSIAQAKGAVAAPEARSTVLSKDGKAPVESNKKSRKRMEALNDEMAEPRADSAGSSRERSAVARSKPTESKTAEQAPAWEEVQNQNLQEAAKSKRCKEVGRIANDILDKNERYYKQEVDKTKAAEDCRYFIASETKRRATTRQKQAAARAGSKQGNSVPSKAKAAAEKSLDSEAADAL